MITGWTDEMLYGRMDGWLVRWIDKWMDKLSNIWKEGWMDNWLDGWMDEDITFYYHSIPNFHLQRISIDVPGALLLFFFPDAVFYRPVYYS